MRPIAGTLQQQIDAVLSNCAEFDHQNFAGWLMQQDDKIRHVASKVPPDRLYMLKSTPIPIYAYVEGYGAGRVYAYLIPTGGVLPVEPSDLSDVTEQAINGELRLR